jgi:hypothetical protein
MSKFISVEHSLYLVRDITRFETLGSNITIGFDRSRVEKYKDDTISFDNTEAAIEKYQSFIRFMNDGNEHGVFDLN